MRLERVLPERAGGAFDRALRTLVKDYPSVVADVRATFGLLLAGSHPVPSPHIHVIPGLGAGATVIKVRVPSSDMQRGKSGGFRVLLAKTENPDEWIPFFIYAKTQFENPPRAVILRALQDGR